MDDWIQYLKYRNVKNYVENKNDAESILKRQCIKLQNRFHNTFKQFNKFVVTFYLE